jgi:hypothetical protein
MDTGSTQANAGGIEEMRKIARVMRCPLHDEHADLRTDTGGAKGTSYEVTGCCRTLRELVQRRLDPTRARHIRWFWKE